MFVWQLILSVLAIVASAASLKLTPSSKRNNNGPSSDDSRFVKTQGGEFFVNGSRFRFVGTNAYWLHTLNTDEDINNTLADIAAANITVVRTWGFNDVETIPENGTWFQHINNGTITINNGTNGLQRLDKVIEIAQKHGIYILLSLTNNWNPHPLDVNAGPAGVTARQIAQPTNNTRPRNTLSNDYGGMDVYVRQLGDNLRHDQFYTNQTLIEAFQNYTTAVVSRYKDNPFVLGWELANDPRCNSSLPATPQCETTIVTRWHSTIATHVLSVDPNHLVSSGNQGFFCPDCRKLFQKPPALPPPPAPAPQPSPAPGTRRQSAPEPLTKAKLLKERKALWKKSREFQKRSGKLLGGVNIRGRWVASQTRRQEDLGIGSAFDGSHGVDSEDIISIPQIGFGSFQLFPDQNGYGPTDPTLPAFNQTLQAGLDWIQRHADAARMFGKPVSLTGFGLVTANNSLAFVPFNSTVAPFGSDEAPAGNPQQPFGVTDAQRDEAYSQWLQAALIGGLQGIIQYQWGQGNLTGIEGTTISPSTNESGVTPNQDESGISPNDGYSTLGIGHDDVIQTIKGVAQRIGPDV